MKIFADLHHQGLYASFHYLFENRLKHQLYRPIGIEWFDKGFWKVAEPYNNNSATIKQYLQIDSNFRPADNTTPLNKHVVIFDSDFGIYDGVHDYSQKALTFKQFLAMDIDIVIASIPAHIDAYKRLIEKHKPKAKLIYHIGNIGWHAMVPWEKVDNLMASVRKFPAPENKNVVLYRQEFDLGVFKPGNSYTTNTITSFVNCLPHPQKWEKLKKLLPAYVMRAYGITCPDGIVNSVKEIALKMQQAQWGYHNKPYGDGFGHIIHNWMAVAKPVLVNLKDYENKLAGELLVEGETCFDIRDPKKVAEVVKNTSDLEYTDLCNNVKRKFKEVVNFEKDAENVKRFLNDLQ